jgi:Ca2+-binding RTX toxin-like protein
MAIVTAYDAMGFGLNMINTDSAFVPNANLSPDREPTVKKYDSDTYLISQWFDGYSLNLGMFASQYSGNIWTLESLIAFNSSASPLLAAYNVNIRFDITDDFSNGAVFQNLYSRNDTISGNKYADIIKSGGGNDILIGNVGNDTLFGESGNDTLNGGDGDDALDGGAGNDALNGGNGNDRYLITELTGGNDTITDTGGTDDSLIWNSSASSNTYVNVSRGGVTNANLVVQVYQEGALKQTATIVNQFSSSSSTAMTVSGSAPISNVERLYIADLDLYLRMINGLTGTNSDELIVGTAAANMLSGNGGIDFMYGGAGNDTLDGGAGDDLLNGGVGSDVLRGSTGNDRYEILELTGGNDTITDTSGTADTLIWNSSNANTYVDVLRSGTSMQVKVYQDSILKQTTTVTGQFASSVLSATPATAIEYIYLRDDDLDLYATNKLVGTSVNELIVGTGSNDTLTGNGGVDYMYGGAGNDTLDGGTGDDLLNGGVGSDVLRGSLGTDGLYGGIDRVRDIFDFNSIAESKVGVARDRIYDFVAKIDKIDLSGIDASTKASGDQVFKFTATTAKANSVWYKSADVDGSIKTKDIIIYGDVNGDAKADFEIGLVGVTSIASSDFVL